MRTDSVIEHRVAPAGKHDAAPVDARDALPLTGVDLQAPLSPSWTNFNDGASTCRLFTRTKNPPGAVGRERRGRFAFRQGYHSQAESAGSVIAFFA